MPHSSANTVPSRPFTVVERRTSAIPTLPVREVWSYRELLIFLVWRDLKVRYKQTILGVTWSFFQPLLTIVMFTVTFSKWAKIPSDNTPYPLFVFLGVLAWNFFAAGTRNAVNSITSSAALISKVYFPRLLCPCSAVAATLADLLVASTLLIPLALRYHVAWSVTGAVLCLAIVGGIGLFSLGFGLWLGPINARFRDVAQVLPFAFQLWMYATPVIYPMGIVPEKYRAIVALNPMVAYIEGLRNALVGRPIDYAGLGWAMGVTLVIFLSGLFFFQTREADLADYLG